MEAEGAVQRGAAGEAEVLVKLGRKRDVAAREAVDGLPIVADRKQLSPAYLRLERLDQPRPPLSDVLEFVHKDVAERGAVRARHHMLPSPGDHVVEVDLAAFVQPRLIVGVQLAEQFDQGT